MMHGNDRGDLKDHNIRAKFKHETQEMEGFSQEKYNIWLIVNIDE